MKKKKQWLWEFSKRIVVLVAIAFFIVLIYSLVFLVLNPDSTAIQFLLDNMASIFKVTVISYAVKAGFENVTKIKKYDKEDQEDEVDY
jgi:NADH:ubiquinone oxidoreductase subunit 2 (subunit N)